MSDERKKQDEDVEAHRLYEPVPDRTFSPSEERVGRNDTEEEDVEAHRLYSPEEPGRTFEPPERAY
jgi:hypothetical protein